MSSLDNECYTQHQVIFFDAFINEFMVVVTELLPSNRVLFYSIHNRHMGYAML